MPMVTAPEHRQWIRRFRALNATYGQNRDLITIGAYVRGSDPRVDEAIHFWPGMLGFLRQDADQRIPLAQSIDALRALFASEPGELRQEGEQ